MQERRVNGVFTLCCWECKIVQSQRQRVWWLLVKLNTCLSYGPAGEALRYLLKWNENLFSHENWFTNACSSFMHYHPKLEDPRFSNWWTQKQNYGTSAWYSSATNTWLLIHTTTWTDLKYILQVKEVNSKECMPYHSICLTFWKRENYRSGKK